MMKEEIIAHVRTELKQNADEKTRQSSQHFFKESIQCYGIKSQTVTEIGKKYYPYIKNYSKPEIFNACERFLESGYLEESFIACNWSYNQRKSFVPEDFLVFKRWIETYIHNWATCDTFCNHTVGSFIEMFPTYLEELKKMAQSDNRWVKRASAVSLIIPARRGKFLADIFEIANILLLDKDDIVQKGYGWMLKAASQAHQQEVFDYVMKHKMVMPRTALRYAIEKMPEEMRKKAMAKN